MGSTSWSPSTEPSRSLCAQQGQREVACKLLGTLAKAAGVSETALDGPLVIGEGLWIVWRVRIRDCSCGAVKGLRVWSATHDIG